MMCSNRKLSSSEIKKKTNTHIRDGSVSAKRIIFEREFLNFRFIICKMRIIKPTLRISIRIRVIHIYKCPA